MHHFKWASKNNNNKNNHNIQNTQQHKTRIKEQASIIVIVYFHYIREAIAKIIVRSLIPTCFQFE